MKYLQRNNRKGFIIASVAMIIFSVILFVVLFPDIYNPSERAALTAGRSASQVSPVFSPVEKYGRHIEVNREVVKGDHAFKLNTLYLDEKNMCVLYSVKTHFSLWERPHAIFTQKFLDESRELMAINVTDDKGKTYVFAAGVFAPSPGSTIASLKCYEPLDTSATSISVVIGHSSEPNKRALFEIDPLREGEGA